MNFRNSSNTPRRTSWWLLTAIFMLGIQFTATAQFPQTFDAVTFPPTGWAKFETGTDVTNSWIRTTTTQSGAGAAFIRYSAAGANVDYLVTPQFTPTAGQSLTFWEREAFSAPYGSTYSVRVSTTTQTGAAAFTTVLFSRAENGSLTYTQQSISLAAYVGTPIYIAFVNSNNDGDSWYVDQVDVATPPAGPCTAPTALAACGTTQVVTLLGTGGQWNPSTTCFASPGAEKVYTYTPPTTGTYTLEVTASTGSSYVDYGWKLQSAGCSSTGWTCIDDFNATGIGAVSLSLTAGVPIYILADNESGASTMTQTFRLNCATAGPCTAPTALAACGTTQVVTLLGTGGQWNPSTTCFSSPGAEKVYTYTPPTTGTYTLEVTASTGSSYIDYGWKLQSAGCSSTGWTCIDDFSTTGIGAVSLSLTAGVPIYILADNESGSSTMTQTFRLNCAAPPPVDPCTTPTAMPACGTSLTTTVVAGTGAWTNFTDCSFSFPLNGREYIYTYTPAVTGSYTAEVTSMSTASEYVDFLYRSTACAQAGWTCIMDVNGTFTSAGFTLTAGTPYRFLVKAELTSTSGGVTWRLNCPVLTPPANDNCAGAATLTSNVSCSVTFGDVTNATSSGVTGCAGTPDDDIWYKFTATNTTHTITVDGSTNFDAVVDLRSGGAFPGTCNGSNLACADNTGSDGIETITYASCVVGQVYFVRVYDYYTGTPATSVFTICVTNPAPPPPANDLCGGAIVVSSYPYTSPIINTASALDGAETSIAGYACNVAGVGGPYKNVWWQVTGVCGTMTASTCNTGTSINDTEIAVYSGTCGALVYVNCNDDDAACPGFTLRSTVTWTATQGTTYYIAAGSYSSTGATGDLVVSVTVVDADGDGVGDACDNCVSTPNPTQANADGDAAGDACDLCPADPNKIAPGICGCGVADTDTDGDLTADCNDLCPLDPNKIAPGQCGCGNLDTDTDGDLTADCNDLCPLDPNKVAPGQCGCGNPDTDTDGDLTADCNDICPTVANGNPGDACDDGNAFTFNDMLGASTACSCAGTACTETVTIEMGTDGTGLRWTLRDSGNNTVVQSSPGYPAYDYPPTSPNYTVTTCLPDGSFYFVFEDENCDGIVGGGYIVRVGGQRVIDNRTNLSGCPSQITGNMGVNVPVGNDRLITQNTDRLDLRRGVNAACSDKLTANDTYGLSPVYQFWFYAPNGGLSFTYPASGPGSNVVNMASLPSLVDGVIYNVRVRSWTGTQWRAWGPAGRMRIDNPLGQCKAASLYDDISSPNNSCGKLIALPVGNQGNSAANRVTAWPVTRFNNNCVSVNANKYQFRFRIVAENVVIVRTSNNYHTFMTTSAGFAPCKPYEVEVRASFDNGATWCIADGSDPYNDLAPWGDICMVNTGGCSNGGGNQNIAVQHGGNEPVEVRMYPNPNRGDQLTLSLSAVEEGVNTVSVDIYDLFGKRVSARTIAVNDGFINTVLELNGELAAGMYMVNITAGETVYTERLVIQP